MNRIKKYFLVVLLAITLLILTHYTYYYTTGNFHVVTKGEAYRSGQLNKDRLIACIKKYKLKSILNLRGKEQGALWYDDELKICSDFDIQHYDVALSATREISEENIEYMVNVFQSAPRPILIHCLAGADRSGFAAALWKVVVDKETEKEAQKQLSIIYGHLPFVKTKAMDKSFKKYMNSRLIYDH